MKFSFYKLIRQEIYLLQLENYSIVRFITGCRAIFRSSLREERTKIKWTPKLILIVLGALSVTLTTVGLVLYGMLYVHPLLAIFGGVFSIIFSHFVFCGGVILSLCILTPFDKLIKEYILLRARMFLRNFPDLCIIGITGSYGKSSVKEVLATILSEKFNVLKTPENINTPIGIARLILSRLDRKTDIFIVEMGAYTIGDIKKLCALVKPRIGILTGIGESHLARFKTIENTIRTKFEIIQALPADGIAVLNYDDELVRNRAAELAGSREILWYSSKEFKSGELVLRETLFSFKTFSWSFFLNNETFNIPILGSYAPGMVLACALVARKLGMSLRDVRKASCMIKPFPHRLDPSPSTGGITIIDDGYNGNPRGAAEAISVLRRFKGRRTIYVTPGLVEMGSATERIHRGIAKDLSKSVELVILIDNQRSRFIRNELDLLGFSEKNIVVYQSAKQAHESIGALLRSGDVVLFQNDIPDNYLLVDN